jgi:hypothetical protein
MRRIILSIVLTISFFANLHAQLQFGSQRIELKDSVLYACNPTASVKLTANFLQGSPTLYAKNTKAYTGVSIPFNSQPWFNNTNATGSPVATVFSNEDDTNRVALPFKFCFWGTNYPVQFLR